MTQYLLELILLVYASTLSALLAKKLFKLEARLKELESDVSWLNSRFKRAAMRKQQSVEQQQ